MDLQGKTRTVSAVPHSRVSSTLGLLTWKQVRNKAVLVLKWVRQTEDNTLPSLMKCTALVGAIE